MILSEITTQFWKLYWEKIERGWGKDEATKFALAQTIEPLLKRIQELESMTASKIAEEAMFLHRAIGSQDSEIIWREKRIESLQKIVTHYRGLDLSSLENYCTETCVNLEPMFSDVVVKDDVVQSIGNVDYINICGQPCSGIHDETELHLCPEHQGSDTFLHPGSEREVSDEEMKRVSE